MGTRGVSAIAAVVFAFAFGAKAAEAQQLLMPSSPPPGQFRQFSPGGGAGGVNAGSTGAGSTGGVSLLPPSGGGLGSPRPAPQQGMAPAVTLAPASGPAGGSQVSLSLVARFSHDAPAPITNGLLWRVFPARPDATGVFRPVKEDKSANPVMALPPGDYVIHVSFGLASAARAIKLKEASREVFEILAGGVKLEGRVGDARIPESQISFDIYKGSQFDAGDKTVLVQGVSSGELVVVPEGNYHIVSNYGDTNAVVRSDIRVQAGKLTDVTVNHRAALITLKLVNERGGEALANTGWSVITPGGDVVKESIGAFPKVVLAEGDYRAIARNDGHSYERDFKVITGVDGEVEVLAHR